MRLCKCGCGKEIDNSTQGQRMRLWHPDPACQVKYKAFLAKQQKLSNERARVAAGKSAKDDGVRLGGAGDRPRPKICKRCVNLPDNRPPAGCPKPPLGCGLPRGQSQ